MRYLPSLLATACWINVAAVLAGEPTAKPGRTAPLPAVVAAAVESVAKQCSEVGGTPRTADAVTRVDLNGDGREDFVLDLAAVSCDGAASIYGDRAKSVTVYAGDGHGGAVAAFEDSVFGAKLEGTGGAAKLWLTVSGEQCGKKPARDFASEAFCERPLVWNATARKFEYAPVAAVRMIQ
jgi:hypothetical protein